jgi:hypothetical protein
MRNEFVGSIMAVRAVEDTIRATKKYTKGLFRKSAVHPIQGEDFPSKVLTEHYEYYPDGKPSIDMSIINAVLWLADFDPHIDVDFSYNYQRDKAMVVIHGGDGVMDLLKEGIPGFEEALGKVLEPTGVDPIARKG